MTISIVEMTQRVELAIALNGVESFIRRFIVLTPQQSTLVALWVAQTHAIEAFEFTAYLNIHSPLPECGKTRLLEVLEALVVKPWFTGRVTAAVLVRKVDKEHPVLLLDESDAAFNGDEVYTEALRSILNSGFQRSGKSSVCVGQGANIGYRDFSTFGPKAIAGIGKNLPSTVVSRSIPIALKRRSKVELIDKFRHRDVWDAAAPIREALTQALARHIEALRAARPVFPDGLSDRAEDVLEPLLALADLAGETWAAEARASAVALMGLEARAAQEADQNFGLELLGDIRGIFEAEGNSEALATKTILDGLIALEDRAWATFNKNEKPINGHTLARLLKPFGVLPAGPIRIDTAVVRGYRFPAFVDAFARYLPIEALQRNNSNKTGPETAKTQALHASAVTLAKTAVDPDKHWVCNAVTLSNPDHRETGVDTADPPMGISRAAWQRFKKPAM